MSDLTSQEIDFLRESNAIEGVFDDDSLQQAIFAWEYLKTVNVLTVHDVLKAHKILMLNQPLQPNEKGYFRRVPVWIAGREAMEWQRVPSAVQMWCFEGIRAHPPIDPIQLHVAYENIHPFVDGNGRTGRLFMNWQFVKRLNQPVMVIRADERQLYYNWFRKF
jgi:Fic family protein